MSVSRGYSSKRDTILPHRSTAKALQLSFGPLSGFGVYPTGTYRRVPATTGIYIRRADGRRRIHGTWRYLGTRVRGAMYRLRCGILPITLNKYGYGRTGHIPIANHAGPLAGRYGL